MSEKNGLLNNSADEKFPYPLTPIVIETKLDQEFTSETDVINLVHEGNGIFSVESNSQEQNDQSIKENNQQRCLSNHEVNPRLMRNKKSEDEGVRNGVNEVSNHQEDPVVLRHTETFGNVHERLTNETSSGKSSKIVIVSTASSMRIFSNPKFARALIEESEFGEHLKGQIEVKGKGKSVKLLIDSNANLDISKIKKLGDYSIHAWYPLDPNHRVGVVSPVDVNLDLAKEFSPFLNLGSDTNHCKIIDVRRMSKFGRELPCVKIVFECKVLPKKIIFNKTLLNVRPYFHNPLVCFKCQNYGHGANSCTNKITCAFCLAGHHLEDCLQDGDPKCLHCNLDHGTGTKECEFFFQASKIENKKRNGEISYEDSKTFYNALNKCTLQQLRNDVERDILRGSNSHPDLNNSSFPLNKNWVRDNREIPLRNSNNRFQPLATINNDLDSSNDDDLTVNSIYSDSTNNYNVRKKVQRSRHFRKYKSYAHCLSTGDLPSDDSPSFEFPQEKIKRNINTNLKRSNIEKNSNSNLPKTNSLADCFIKDFKDSFLYKLLIKIRTFYDKPNKTGFQWVSFLMDMFDFVGHYSEENQ